MTGPPRAVAEAPLRSEHRGHQQGLPGSPAATWPEGVERIEKQPTVKGPAELFTKVIVMRPGDTVHTPPGEEHWHGAVDDQFMTHLAMWEDDDATWGAHVTDQEYDAACREARA